MLIGPFRTALSSYEKKFVNTVFCLGVSWYMWDLNISRFFLTFKTIEKNESPSPSLLFGFHSTI